VSELPVLVTHDGDVAVLTLNRPRVHNALNNEVLRLLGEALDTIVADGSANAIILTGSGESPSARVSTSTNSPVSTARSPRTCSGSASA
jgi:enoyl-CoA hydratase